jgi:hypothetical protein
VKRGKGWFAWLFSEAWRRARRHKSLPLVAYYWDGGEPVAHSILDASSTGIYLQTDERWHPGTVVMMTLQRTLASTTDPERSIAVNARVMRSGVDGVGLEFVLPHRHRSHRAEGVPTREADVETLCLVLDRLQSDKG